LTEMAVKSEEEEEEGAAEEGAATAAGGARTVRGRPSSLAPPSIARFSDCALSASERLPRTPLSPLAYETSVPRSWCTTTPPCERPWLVFVTESEAAAEAEPAPPGGGAGR
jgi:hypothetical protein